MSPPLGGPMLEEYGHRWLKYWHGAGGVNQYQFYRCHGCHRVVTWKQINSGGCSCKATSKVSPAMLTRWEKVKLLLMPWVVSR
jgi:hypothetical protein